ncbi:MAG: amidohydrolase family protein [Nannocystaceae bacterium]
MRRCSTTSRSRAATASARGRAQAAAGRASTRAPGRLSRAHDLPGGPRSAGREPRQRGRPRGVRRSHLWRDPARARTRAAGRLRRRVLRSRCVRRRGVAAGVARGAGPGPGPARARQRVGPDRRRRAGGGYAASSADHLLYLDDDDRRRLPRGRRGRDALLPGTSAVLGKPYADGRALVEAGVPIAVATDCNPGSCAFENLAMVLALACYGNRLLPAQAICAATHNAAASLGLADQVGSLQPGRRADLLVLATADVRDLVYHAGSPLVEQVWQDGVRVA